MIVYNRFMNETPLSLLDKITDISQAKFKETVQNPKVHKIGEFRTSEAVKYVVNYLKAEKPDSEPLTAQFLGSPGSGKSKFAELILPEIHKAVVLATDDYNTGTREERKKIIAAGGNATQEKDFELLAFHINSLRHLNEEEIFYLPYPYDPNTGGALNNGLTRKVVGSFDYIIVDGNFYVGDGGVSNVPLDCLIYFQMNDKDRLHTRLIRDLAEGQVRGRDAEEIIDQFISRQKLQDEPFTLPFMNEANLIIETKPQFSDQSIKDFDYLIYQREN